MFLFCFFFQAEDGIRDADVTGVQTCALPIFGGTLATLLGGNYVNRFNLEGRSYQVIPQVPRGMRLSPEALRSEERRVGKECRSRCWPEHEKKKGKGNNA